MLDGNKPIIETQIVDSADLPPENAVLLGRESPINKSQRFREALSPIRVIGILFILVLIVTTIAANWLPLADPIAKNVDHKLEPVGAEGFLLGTDQMGRDVLSRLLHGAETELLVAIGATALAMIIGTILGLVGGFYGGLIESLTMRSVDVVLAFPPIILAMLVVTIYGAGPVTLIFVMGLLFSPAYARLTYGQVLTVKSAEYVEASQVFGASKSATLFSVVLPNVATPIIVQMPLTLAGSILLESGLSYLGLGIVPPAPSWGFMVADGKRYMHSNPELVLVPAIVIALTILAFGLFGDFLRDWLDPRRAMAKNY
ncbi:ABC transporter permease [Flaviflexus massiliensis]|uniref:ABC transporter permease n=1 Tax=Flaviflexus massiliensis TaxID=1522309 RepID=UPI0006D571DC|nr:ABC transporter permease [Flaviflexus massiliensis]